MTKERTCFVAMPIKRDGTDDFAHFMAIYEQGIKPVVTKMGYKIIRADEVQKTGAITRDIVQWLATANLVVVDLTDLNPNVFYELGVRHALRANGTIMIIDEVRSTIIPFDLGAYRVIQFKGDLTGIGKLKTQLESFVRELDDNDSGHRDNPVHDTIPSLPLDAVASSRGSVEGELREKLADAQSRIRKYELAYGKDSNEFDESEQNPLDVIMNALSLADEGNLPMDILKGAQEAVRERNVKSYLSIIRRVIERSTRLSDDNFVSLSNYANQLGLSDVTSAIYEHALQLYPRSKTLRENQLSLLATSEDSTIRARTRLEILKEIGIAVKDNEVIISDTFDKKGHFLLSRVMDSYNHDSLYEEALRISQAVVVKFPNSSSMLRNHARILFDLGRVDEAIENYQKSLWCSEPEEQSAIWFGIELYNTKRFVDAIEVYLWACRLNPDDGGNFTFLAEAMYRALRGKVTTMSNASSRQIPDALDTTDVEKALICALSAGSLDHKDIRRWNDIAERLNIKIDPNSFTPMTFNERFQFVFDLYKAFESPLTNHTKSVSKDG